MGLGLSHCAPSSPSVVFFPPFLHHKGVGVTHTVTIQPICQHSNQARLRLAKDNVNQIQVRCAVVCCRLQHSLTQFAA